MDMSAFIKSIFKFFYQGLLDKCAKELDKADSETKKKLEKVVPIILIIAAGAVIATLLVIYAVKPEAYSVLMALVDALPNIESSTIVLDVSLEPFELGGFNFDGAVPTFSVNLLVVLGFVILIAASVLLEKLNPFIAMFSAVAAPVIFLPGIIKAFNLYLASGLSAWDATLNLMWPLAITFVLTWSCSSIYIAREALYSDLRDVEKRNRARERAFEKDINKLHKERENIEGDIAAFDRRNNRELEKARKRWDSITRQYTEKYPYTIDEQERYCKFVAAVTGKQPNAKDYDYLSKELDEYDDSYDVFDEIMGEYREVQISKYKNRLDEINKQLSQIEQDVADFDQEVDDRDPLLYILGMGLLASLLGGIILLAISVAILTFIKISYLTCIPAVVVVVLTCMAFMGAKKDVSAAK